MAKMVCRTSDARATSRRSVSQTSRFWHSGLKTTSLVLRCQHNGIWMHCLPASTGWVEWHTLLLFDGEVLTHTHYCRNSPTLRTYRSNCFCPCGTESDAIWRTGSIENERPQKRRPEDLRPTKMKTYENEDPLRKRRPPTKKKTPLFFVGNEIISIYR